MSRLGLGIAAIGLALAGAAVAQGVPGLHPRLPYAATAPDEQLSLGGARVLAPGDAEFAERLKKEKARVAASQPYEVRPAIWKIADADTTIYLFGTVHSLPPGFRWRNPGLEGVIVRADTLLLESTDDDATSTTDFMGGLPTDASLPPLIERVSHRSRARLAAMQGVLPAELVAQMDKMPSWVAAMGIGYIKDLIAGDMPSQGADDWLEKQFRATGRPVEAIEDSDQVMRNIGEVPEEAQRLMLESAILSPARTHDELDAVAHAFARGEVGPDSPLVIQANAFDPAGAINDPLLAERNSAWVDSLIARLKVRKGTTLFAAGAGHFVGAGSVIELLGKRGLKVERVQ
ncbi:TraB/GumN family protein [Sphingomonas sp. HITSZ_GF]|uniref:TraB/GumN family protein n=1 Tax=Sphingomonas sp. HITSZ_GF TaxID=3037247 RepID=UPI00240E88C8|nr:TraB/GumN family protein [Sphingomonas sp. HITSZ_GF]MDG2535472.1 TraB/GumN family protein [Sphingomonas sp. HITSZ_GF]